MRKDWYHFNDPSTPLAIRFKCISLFGIYKFAPTILCGEYFERYIETSDLLVNYAHCDEHEMPPLRLSVNELWTLLGGYFSFDIELILDIIHYHPSKYSAP